MQAAVWHASRHAWNSNARHAWNSKLQRQATVLLRYSVQGASQLRLSSIGWRCKAGNDKKRVNEAELRQSGTSMYQAANNKMRDARHSGALDVLQWRAIIADQCTACTRVAVLGAPNTVDRLNPAAHSRYDAGHCAPLRWPCNNDKWSQALVPVTSTGVVTGTGALLEFGRRHVVLGRSEERALVTPPALRAGLPMYHSLELATRAS